MPHCSLQNGCADITLTPNRDADRQYADRQNLGIVQRALDRVAAAMRKDGDNAFFRFDMSPQDGSLGYGAGYHPSMRQAERWQTN